MNFVQNTKYLILILLLIFAACSIENIEIKEEENSSLLSDGEVAFNASMGSDDFTRTYLDSDMSTTRWSEDDKLYLWAYSDESTIYNGAEFSLRYYGANYYDATFIGTAEYSSNEEQLRYFATYPEPNSVSGSSVTYNIPAIQSGKYDDGLYDIMYATPIIYDAFVDGEMSDLKLSFNHLMHSLCITVPDDRNLLGDGISSLEIDFPTNVVGDITFDITGLDSNGNLLTTDPTTSLSNGSSSIVLNFEEPLDEGGDVWVFINPTYINGTITFRAISDNGLRSNDISTTVDKSMEAGRVTPITLTIPDELARTTINVSITANNLGEDPNTVTFTAPSGALFRNGSNVVTVDYSMVSIYELEYYTSLYGDLFKNGGITVDYDSENAEVSSTISLTDVADSQANNKAITVPYLMFEDFSTVETFDYKSAYQTSSAGTGKTITLTQYGLDGWTADRAGAEEGLSLRTACRLEAGMWVQVLYRGRLDSAPISNLKDGKSVKVNVFFNYSGGRYEGTGSTNGTPKFEYGYTDDTGELDGGDDIENTVGSGVQQGITGSYNSVGNSLNYDITGCTNAIRLSWRATVTRSTEFAQNGNYWLYIDNVAVKINK